MEVFLPEKRLLYLLLVIFSPRHNENWRKALNVGHLVRDASLEELVQLQLFSIRKVNKCPKGFGSVSNFINFLGEKRNVIDFLVDFYVFSKVILKLYKE